VLITHEPDVAGWATRIVRFRDGVVQDQGGGPA
jgi:ABC-type lipoprotein export system ATPase subunit